MGIIEAQAEEMLKYSEEPVPNFTPRMELSWPPPESRRESKCETNIDDLVGFCRERSNTEHSRNDDCWSAPGNYNQGGKNITSSPKGCPYQYIFHRPSPTLSLPSQKYYPPAPLQTIFHLPPSKNFLTPPPD